MAGEKFVLLNNDLLHHGYTYNSARPVGAMASAKSVLTHSEDVCLPVAG